MAYVSTLMIVQITSMLNIRFVVLRGDVAPSPRPALNIRQRAEQEEAEEDPHHVHQQPADHTGRRVHQDTLPGHLRQRADRGAHRAE